MNLSLLFTEGVVPYCNHPKVRETFYLSNPGPSQTTQAGSGSLTSSIESTPSNSLTDSHELIQRIIEQFSDLDIMQLSGKIIILEGPISIGKTTLGYSLEQTLTHLGLKVKFIPEFVNEPLLNLYLSDRKKYAFLFQIIAQRERFHIHKRAIRLAEEGYLVLIDRGVTGDLMFAIMQRDEGFFTDEEWRIYWETVQLHQKGLFRPNLVIYLNCSPEIAFERLKRRGNQTEIEAYSLEYFESLQKACVKARMETDQSSYAVDLNWSMEDPQMYQNSDKQWRLSSNYLHKFIDWLLRQIIGKKD